jgi:hypothetical protein
VPKGHLETSKVIDMHPLTALNNLESISNSHISKEVAQFPLVVKLEIVGGGGALSQLISLSTKLRHLNL